MLQLNYKIYPSLLDKFQRLLDIDKDFESPWNEDAEGGYKRSVEEMTAEAEQSLLDSINRVPFESEVADKGTAFNALVDYLCGAALPDTMTVELRCDEDGVYGDWYHVTYAERVHREFDFSADLASKAATIFLGCVPQYRCEAVLDTKYGLVQLYGYADEIGWGKVFDIKTTSRYEWGKYEHGWQRYVYPYCLVAGEGADIFAFEFVAFAWKSRANAPLDATVYRELYDYNHAEACGKLAAICERFIEWIEAHRDQITDKKIFAEE